MKIKVTSPIFLLLIIASTFAGAPTTQPIGGGDTQPLVIHLPGIGGHRLPDEFVKQGLTQAGLGAEIYIYDWTGRDEGFNALTNVDRHRDQAAVVAKMIAEVAQRQPGRRIIITCHSAGAGIAAWALAQLPEGVMIDDWVMLAPALSPRFNLSDALRRVRGNAYSFNSLRDPILGMGTRNFGTVDRVRSDAAGRVGFEKPTNADEQAYAKLTQFPYDDKWLRYYNAGDHIGATMRPFVREVIAPLLKPDEPTTRPAE